MLGGESLELSERGVELHLTGALQNMALWFIDFAWRFMFFRPGLANCIRTVNNKWIFCFTNGGKWAQK